MGYLGCIKGCLSNSFKSYILKCCDRDIACLIGCHSADELSAHSLETSEV